MKKMHKKGMSLNDLPNIALVFLLVGIFFAVTLLILSALQSSSAVTVNGSAYNAIAKVVTAVAEIPNNWLLIIAIVVAAAVIIGLVISSFRGSTSGR